MPINTKAIIAETLLKMMKNKSFDNITVKDLTEVCGVSRQTFYYHFQDILDVVEWSARQALQRALEQSLKAKGAQQAVRYFVDMAVENRAQVECLLRSRYKEQFIKTFLEDLETYLREMIRRNPPEHIGNKVDSDVAIQFCACGIAGVLFRFTSARDMDKERMTRQLSGFLEWLTR